MFDTQSKKNQHNNRPLYVVTFGWEWDCGCWCRELFIERNSDSHWGVKVFLSIMTTRLHQSLQRQLVLAASRTKQRTQGILVAPVGSIGRCFLSTTSSDTRLAGRPRFYKQVGVTSLEAPWEATPANEVIDTVKSPISAGVDGTDSASGVHQLSSSSSTPSSLQWMLSPRRPGTTETTNNKEKWFGVTLDGRAISTPMGQKLAVPSERLAYAIAAEWDAQTKQLQPANMPFMTLACTALDQVAHHPDVYREQALNFLPTDTVRC